MKYKNISNQERWDYKNPVELQHFEVGDSLLFRGQVFRICFVTGMTGIDVEKGKGQYFTIDDVGMVNRVENTIDELLGFYADQDFIIKVKASGFDDGFVIYTPVYEKRS